MRRHPEGLEAALESSLRELPRPDVAHLFRPLLAELVALLRTLDPDRWDRPTVARGWSVRDVAAHLLDGDLRKLAACRDGHDLPHDAPVVNAGDVARLVNALNASGVMYARRLSPALLTDLLAVTGEWVARFVESLPPRGPAHFPVSWAGESASENWMDTGREYTERWHHQAQIRDAVGAPPLLTPRWMEPLLGFSVRVLGPAYRGIVAPVGTAITLVVDGETCGAWSVVREPDRWQVYEGAAVAPAARVHVGADEAWRLFYNALPVESIAGRVQVEGDAALARPLLRARSVIL
jgi:uncharacterized protein (TIGR03083 family)